MTRGERNIRWIEGMLRIPDGPQVGKPMKLLPWQQDLISRIYDNPDGTRTAIVSMARKNGKTALSASLLLLHFVGPESRQNSQLYSAARTRDQAGLVYDYARLMIEQNPKLMTVIQLVKSIKVMRCEARGTTFKALSADATAAFGLNPSFAIHDELGQVKGPTDALFAAVESAMGAQEEPLSVAISTQAATDDDLLSILIDDALAGHDPKTICILHSADGLDDPMTPEGLAKANPSFGHFMNTEETVRRMEESMRLPASRSSFQNLNLNMRVAGSDYYISRDEWMACAGEPAPLEECEVVFAGLDLSRSRDLTAFVQVGYKGGKFHVHPKFWLPADGLLERSQSQRIPYFDWHQDGYLEATPGTIIDRSYVAEQLRTAFEARTIATIAYDAWDFNHIKRDLVEAGFPQWQIDSDEGDDDEMLFEMFRQGFVTMSPALRTVEQLIVNGQVVHPNNPVLNFNMANCVVIHDTTGNRKLDKSSSTKTIDGAIAMIMALTVAYREIGEPADPDFKIETLFEE